MGFVRNFPAISILICMFAAIISSGLKRKAARLLTQRIIMQVFLQRILIVNMGQLLLVY